LGFCGNRPRQGCGWRLLRGDPRKQNWENREGEIDEGEHPIWFSGTSWLLTAAGNCVK